MMVNHWLIMAGWWFQPTPLKNDGVRQLGLWHSQLNGQIKFMFQTTRGQYGSIRFCWQRLRNIWTWMDQNTQTGYDQRKQWELTQQIIYSPLTNWDEPASNYAKRPICRFCLLNIMIFHSKPLVYWRVSNHLGVSENGVYLPHAHFDRNI